ncbi:hypothetical protein Y696_01300 [Mesotoga sp. H07pep.5.4]|nr:hypothetical protein Y696_01300 [Mesotoga sp. H07pep.5.4]
MRGSDVTIIRRKAPKSIGGRNAGEEHAGTQGWARTAQVAMLPSAGGDLKPVVLRGQRAADRLLEDESYNH